MTQNRDDKIFSVGFQAQRAEEEARYAEMKREEEEMRIRMAEEEKIRKQEDKLKRLQEAELRRQKMMEEQSKGRNFKIASTVVTLSTVTTHICR